jgi:hypothetical protein
VKVSEWLSERFPFFDALEDEWLPLSRVALSAWLVFYAVCLWGAAMGGGLLRWIDLVFVPIHEGGHLLFGWLGQWIMVAGGTIVQLFVPFALAIYFIFRRHLAGTAFCAFFFFEQFLPIGIYMADARAQALTYVTVGDPENAEHDWFYLFSSLHVLPHDTKIGAAVRVLGWLGMLGTVAWLTWRGIRGFRACLSR